MAKERRKRTPAPKNETPAERFRRLGAKRVNKALQAIHSVGKLTGRSYESTDEQRKRILDVLREEMKATEAALSGSKAAKIGFTL